MKNKVKHVALKQLVSGKVMRCGSGCYQTGDGAQFLGKLPLNAVLELCRLYVDLGLDQVEGLNILDELQYNGVNVPAEYIGN